MSDYEKSAWIGAETVPTIRIGLDTWLCITNQNWDVAVWVRATPDGRGKPHLRHVVVSRALPLHEQVIAIAAAARQD